MIVLSSATQNTAMDSANRLIPKTSGVGYLGGSEVSDSGGEAACCSSVFDSMAWSLAWVFWSAILHAIILLCAREIGLSLMSRF